MINKVLEVQRPDIAKTRSRTLNTPEIADGQISLIVEKFALTANNITYAAIGEILRYWDFYPTDPPWGIVPVWGYGRVVGSKHPSIAVNSRYYGYFPMAQYATLTPTPVNASIFMEGSSQRSKLASVYNTYSLAGNEFGLSDYFPSIRPLFLTSFLIDYSLQLSDYHQAKQIVLTSASSKTALSLAFLLRNKDIRTIGLSSTHNVPFVQKTGYYDEVFPYDQIASLEMSHTVVIDFSGNTDTLMALHELLGTNLLFTNLIGLADWDKYNMSKNKSLGEFFFAPDVANVFYKERGFGAANEEMRVSMVGFIEDSKRFFALEKHVGVAAIEQLYHAFVEGNVNPSKLHLCSF